ncbi:hypothetical protein DFH09DRAFT_1376518 [Mycena vulgaris]|nr:hypothetical protein DFH09DRAFT_1376518 [Mycena vulgaris]
MKSLAGEHSIAAVPDVKNGPAISTETGGANDNANGSSAAQIAESEAEAPAEGGSGSTDAMNERLISVLQGYFTDLARKNEEQIDNFPF